MIDALRKDLAVPMSGRKCANLSLRFHRLSQSIDGKGDHGQKDSMLDDMCRPYFDLSAPNPYMHALGDWRALQDRDLNIEFFEMKLASRLICGMGNKNVQECGATFLMPWGVPYIPGSAVKGVASAYAHLNGGDDWQKTQVVPARSGGKNALLVFGGTDDNKKSYAAGVDFMDAWWLPEGDASPFEQDILTPHNKSYLGSKEPSDPDGTDSPIPVKFLVIKAGVKFLFGLRGPAPLRKVARKIITEALGAGGPGLGSKTRLGYGRFTWVKSEREKEAEKTQKGQEALQEFLEMLSDGRITEYSDAKEYVKNKKLKGTVDKSSAIAKSIYEKAFELWPERVAGNEGWHASFGPAE